MNLLWMWLKVVPIASILALVCVRVGYGRWPNIDDASDTDAVDAWLFFTVVFFECIILGLYWLS